MITPTKPRPKRPPTPRYPPKRPTQSNPQTETIHSGAVSPVESPDDVVATVERPCLVLPTEKYVRIAFCGKLCSGKTTLAQHIQTLCKTHHQIDVQRVAFGDGVKSVAKEYFQMQEKDKDRVLLTQIGTAMRAIDNDVWVHYVRNHITQSSQQHWVVDDVRYENEYDMLKELGFRVIRLDISRDEQLQRIQALYPDTSDAHSQANTHSSEQDMVHREHFYFDEVLSTTDTHQRIQHWLERHYKNVCD